MNERRPDHRALAHALRTRVPEGPGTTEPALRLQVAARAAGGSPATVPYDLLARQIGEAARATTDEQVAEVVGAAGSEKAAFEIISPRRSAPVSFDGNGPPRYSMRPAMRLREVERGETLGKRLSV